MAPVHDVAIVGAGLLGLAAARSVAALGRDFVVLEQAGIGHENAGSKGSCRIFRLGYPDAGHVTAARQARELWRELEAETGRELLLPAPHLTFGPQLAQVHEAMAAAGAPCELLSRQEAAERYPEIAVDGPALAETDSAVLAADEALLAFAAAAGLADCGAPLIKRQVTGGADARGRLLTQARVTGLADDGRQVTLRTTAGEVRARVAIVAAGPWTAGLLAGHVEVPARATLEQVGYLAPAATLEQTGYLAPAATPEQAGYLAPAATPEQAGYLAPAATRQRTPIFIRHGDPSPYGLPVPGSDRYKVGIHHSGPAVSPDAQDQAPDPVLVARLTAVAQRYLPGYLPEPVHTERCVYDNTPDEDFVLDRIGNIVLGCGTSGHGFKFGPLFGTWLAALACGGTELPPGRFGLARITAGSARAPG